MRNNFLLTVALLSSFFLKAQEAPLLTEQTIHTSEIYFDFGKDNIRADADSVLNELLVFCREQSSFYIKITAHTDAVGSDMNNLSLSQRRSAAVITFLEAGGITSDSLIVAVFGEKRPVAGNHTDEGRQKNRRATLEVIKIKKMIPLTGDIVDQETGRAVEADIVVRSKDSSDSLRTDEKGHFESLVPIGEVIGIDVWAKGYFLESQMMRVIPGKKVEVNVQLPPVKEGEKVDIKNLYFVGNQAILLKKSEPELPKILKFLQINDHIKIEIAGHINRPNEPPVSTQSWDYDLSRRRALLVYNFLIDHGISTDRLIYKAYGNWEMRFPLATSEKEQEANRRVEIRVLEVEH